MAGRKTYLLGFSYATAYTLSRRAPNYLVAESVVWTCLSLLTITLSINFIYSVIIFPIFLTPLRHLPQPKGNSLINGQFWKIFHEDNGKPHQQWMESIPNDGLIYYRSILNVPRVLVTTPDALREVLSQKNYEFVKPQLAGFARIVGNGVLLAEGDEHRRQRKNLMPAFSYRHIKDLYPVFWSKTRDLVLALDKHIVRSDPENEKDGKRILVAGAWASRGTLDIIGVATMGRSFGAIENENAELYQTYSNLFKSSRMARILGLLGFFVPEWLLFRLPLQRNYHVQSASSSIRKVCHSMISEKKEKLSKGEASGVDLLSVALNSGGFSDDELVEQLMTFLAAGHETTATALTWAIYLLCKHPAVQTRLRSEVKSALPNIRDPSTTTTPEVLDKIPYLNAVCSEVLRFIPPVPATMRTSPSTPTTLQNQPLPPKTIIFLSPLAINTSPTLWGPTATTFDPARWLQPGQANTGGATSNYAFLTFLHGPRGCIGQGFARAEFACLLAGWVAAFEWALVEPEAKVHVQNGATQRPRDGLRVLVESVGG